jgi:ACS family hexuronate transporter-like MFS transporter
VNSKAKWVRLGFAFLVTVINYLDRQTLSVMASVLLEEFYISARSYSRIIFVFIDKAEFWTKHTEISL